MRSMLVSLGVRHSLIPRRSHFHMTPASDIAAPRAVALKSRTAWPDVRARRARATPRAPADCVIGGLLMSSEEHRRGSGGMSAGRRILGPRPVVMTVAAVCVLGVVLVLAQLVLSSQQASRSAAEQRFANGAVVRGQLTAALLATSSASLRATAPKLAPNSAALRRVAQPAPL